MKQPTWSTAKCSTFHLCPRYRTSTFGHGPRINPKHMWLSSMATHPTSRHRHGQIGFPRQNSTSKPLMPHAFWEQLRARFHLALQQPDTCTKGPIRGFMQQIRQAHQHWMGAPTWGQFLDTCHHWHRYQNPHAGDLMLQAINHQLQEAQTAANEETMLQYKQWLQDGHHKGLRGLFRSLKK